MKERPTKTIELPESKIKVDIKLWINGTEAEYIESALLKAASMTGRNANDINFGIQAEHAIHEQNHRVVEMRVAKIQNGDETVTGAEEILKYILNEIQNSDYEFLLSSIVEIEIEAKKK